MVFQLLGDIHKGVISVRDFSFQTFNLGSIANAGHHVFTLGIDKVFAEHLILASLRIARESDARAGVIAHIAENHSLDIDSGAERVRDVLAAAVINRALGVPRTKYCLDSVLHLHQWVLWEVEAHLALDNLFKLVGQILPIGRVQLSIELDALLGFIAIQNIVKRFIRDAKHNAAKHLHQAAVRICHEAFVAGEGNHTLGSFVVHADIEDSVHHAGHGELGARAAGNQQWILRVAKNLTGFLFYGFQRVQSLLPHPFREFIRFLIRIARFSRNREARGNRNANPHHLSQVRALTA